MPLNIVPLTGQDVLAMANVSRAEKFTFAQGTSNDVMELPVLGLPSLFYSVTLRTGVGGVIFSPLFSVDNVTVGGVPTPNWNPFTNGSVLVPFNVTNFTIRANVAVAGVRIIVPAVVPGGSIAISIVITASG